MDTVYDKDNLLEFDPDTEYANFPDKDDIQSRHHGQESRYHEHELGGGGGGVYRDYGDELVDDGNGKGDGYVFSSVTFV